MLLMSRFHDDFCILIFIYKNGESISFFHFILWWGRCVFVPTLFNDWIYWVMVETFVNNDCGIILEDRITDDDFAEDLARFVETSKILLWTVDTLSTEHGHLGLKYMSLLSSWTINLISFDLCLSKDVKFPF